MSRLPIFLLLLALPSVAHDYVVADLHIIHPWIAAPPPGAVAAAGYVAIANDGTTAERLIGIEADFAERAGIHEMTLAEDGVMQMRPVEGGLVIAPGDVLLLEPGVMHLMFIRLKEQPAAGETRRATLVFEHAGRVEVEFHVEKAQDMDSHGEGHDMEDGMEMEETQ